MNRTGLAIALAIGVAAGLVFALYPQLDLILVAPFYDPATGWAITGPSWLRVRNVASGIIALIAAPAALALIGRLLFPRRPPLMSVRGSALLLLTIALGPGLLANVILKDNWGRPRPIEVTEFGGPLTFRPWWDPRGPCPKNCSFVAGEPSGAFWTMAPAALTPPQWRALAYGGAVVFGAVIGLIRIAGGGHFVSDVVFSGVFMFLLIWGMHGLLFRWRTARGGDKTGDGG
jgi:membrane-associated PAP2 superfamily phosphatase